MTDRATKYARTVVENPAGHGRLHIAACQRHINDIDRQGTKDFPFRWNPELSERVLNYAEQLTIIEGMAPRTLSLLECQAFDIGVTMGWINHRGYRRFRRRYKSVARQNGKTIENGILASYIAGFSGYQFGRLFTAATKHAQAKLVWDEVSKFIQADPDLAEMFSIKEYKSEIKCVESKCTIEALSKERSLDDGFRSIFTSLDELHQQRDGSVYDALYRGQRALPEALISVISTRGKYINTFAKELDDYCVNILLGAARADDFFVDIYCLDDDDNIWDETSFIKANPYLATSEQGMETLRADAATARDMGGNTQKDFINKCMNRWLTSSDCGYIDAEAWQRCGSDRTLNDFRGRSCWVGLDLSSGGDLTTLALEFEEPNDHYYIHTHSFMPRGRLEEHLKTDLAPYDVWERSEMITVTGGQSDYKNDYKFIIKYLQDLRATCGLKFLGIGYDPHNADGILADLEAFGCPLLMITQSARFLNDATVDVQLLVKSGGMEYNRHDDLLSWSVSNAQTVQNSFGEIKVDKEPHARHKRIDAVDAVIDAHTIMMKNREKPILDVVAETEKYLELMSW